MQMFKYVAVFILFSFFCLDKTSAQSTITISTAATNPKCNGGTTGSIVITATGGSGSYQYQLSEAGAGGWQTGNTFTGLIAGTYPVSVKDANNNYKTVYVTLTNPTGITANAISTSASCSSSYDASVTVTPSGGTSPYNYAWTYNNNAITSANASTYHVSGYNTSKVTGPPGSYSVAVTDNNGCSGAVTYYNPDTISITQASFNQDVIVESSATRATLNTNVTSKLDNDATGNVLFEAGFRSNNYGLPTNRIIYSAQDSTLTYYLKEYTKNNSSRTQSGGVTTLNLTTPTALAKVLILGTSGNGITTYSYSINFTDGTTYPGTLTNNTLSYRDWYATTGADLARRNLTRVALGSNAPQSGINYSLFEAPIIIPAPYFNKTISSITLTNNSTSSTPAGNIFAVSGFKASGTASNVGFAAAGTSTPTVTITSDLDSSSNYYCAGQTITYTANTVHGGATPTYTLEASINGGTYSTIASNSTSNTFSVTPASTTTSYAIRVTATASSDAGCLYSTTSAQTVFTATQHAISPTVTMSGSTNICQGTNAAYAITRTTNAGGSPSYTWLVDGVANSGLGTAATANTSTLAAGTHAITVQLKSSITCASNNPVTSSAVSTIVNNSPTPTITISNLNSYIPITYTIADSSNLGKTPSYQWYLNGSVISNATLASYTTPTTTTSGDVYSLKVTSSATCANPVTLMSNYRTVATALPIVLKSFVATAYSNNITLNWQTATEINTDRFEILRKYQDSSAFVTVGTVKATNNASGSSYQFIDYPKFAGNYQYRLKNYDFDGNYQLSDIQSIYFGNNNGTQTNRIFPNPFTDHITINYNSLKSFQGGLVLYNMNGAVVNSKIVSIISGNQNLEISNLSMLPSGMYILKLIDQYNKSIESFKIIKK